MINLYERLAALQDTIEAGALTPYYAEKEEILSRAIASEARVKQLEDAIKEHRAQLADDRCIEDDDKLYLALGDGIKCDRRVGDKAAMLENCERFIEKGGGWKSYKELRDALATIKMLLAPEPESSEPWYVLAAYNVAREVLE